MEKSQNISASLHAICNLLLSIFFKYQLNVIKILARCQIIRCYDITTS